MPGMGFFLSGLVFPLAFAFLGAGWGKAFERGYSASQEWQLHIYAPSDEDAPVLAMQADRVAGRFCSMMGVRSSRSGVPIVLAVGRENEGGKLEPGALRVYRRDRSIKIQVNWDETPVTVDGFQRGVVRALCVRTAFLEMNEKQRFKADLRVPVWVTEGLAVLAMEPDERNEVLGRVSLLARMEPEFSFAMALSELEGKVLLDDNARALAAMICQTLLSPQSTPVLRKNLNWSDSMTARRWLRETGGLEDVERWWKELWKRQAASLSWLRLGFASTLKKVLLMEEIQQGADPGDEARKALAAQQIGPVANPWFRRWFDCARTSMNEDGAVLKLASLRRDAELRRYAALSWLADLHREQPPPSRMDWLNWRVELNDRDRVCPARIRGPAHEWFDAVEAGKR